MFLRVYAVSGISVREHFGEAVVSTRAKTMAQPLPSRTVLPLADRIS